MKIALTIAAVCAAGAAAADPSTVTLRPVNNGAHVADIDFYNGIQYEVTVQTVAIPFGPAEITVEVTNTHNAACAHLCPDTLRVTTLPEGFIAIPPAITVDETGSGKIGIYRLAAMVMG
jgi:hypothetical protein